MIPLISRLVTVLQGSTALASLGSREALIRVSTIGARSVFTRGSVSRAVGQATQFASNLKKMDVQTWTTTIDVLSTLYLVASELFPDASDVDNEDRVTNYATSDKLLGYAVVAHNWALSEEGKDKADEVYDALDELFTEVSVSDMQAIMNLLVAPHLSRIRAAGYLFNLPYVDSRRFLGRNWFAAILRSEDGVDTAGVTSAEILFFGKVIFGFLGTESAVFTAEDQRLWSNPDSVDVSTDSAQVRIARAMVDNHFPANQSQALHRIIDVARG